MLRLSKMADYAVVVLAELARDAVQSQTGAALALKTRLGEPTVAKVLKLLAKAGIVQSSRGMAGGYRLERQASQISVLSIVEAIDGPMKLADCVEGASGCDYQKFCKVKGHWDPVADAIKQTLINVTLADMLPRPCCAPVKASA